jgi:hypothetical protein
VPRIVALAVEVSTIPTKTAIATAQIVIDFFILLRPSSPLHFVPIFIWFIESPSLPQTRKPDVSDVPRDIFGKICDWALASSLLVLLRSYFSNFSSLSVLPTLTFHQRP